VAFATSQEQTTVTERMRALSWLDQETRALAVRLDRVKPFALQETMVAAAAPSPAAQTAIDRYLVAGRRELRRLIAAYLHWLHGPRGQAASLSEAQRRFTFLRLRFNTILSQFDIFADVMTQRSEYETGVWIGGLDVLAADALQLPGRWFDAPPVICYLDRGHGAAIRRARTRLPGGGENPVAIIRIPRERMVSNGIASSLVHEVGHQGVALLDLIPSLQPPLARLQARSNGRSYVWGLFDRWLSEILADCWSVARAGIASTLGLMGVVSLPRAFVFRVSLDDPHPIPWIRVKISCALGRALYPHPQWERVAAMWEGYYPVKGLSSETRRLLVDVEAAIPGFVELLLEHRPASLHGNSLGEVLASRDRTPERLQSLFQQWGGQARQMRRAAPALVFAVVGQARADGRLTPETESRVLSWLLTYWALRDTVKVSEAYVAQLVPRTKEMMEV
jgi:hypothetical protein